MNIQAINVPSPNNRKLHPHKFAMWLAIASIVMMFAGLTSAYMVRQAQGQWRHFQIPDVFWVSTLAILTSSVTFFLGIRAFKQRHMRRFRNLLIVTILLGISFMLLQTFGFYELISVPQALIIDGQQAGESVVLVSGNPSESFLFIIFGLHLLHILGGIVALTIVFLKAYSRRVKIYKSTGLEITATYWHFVDLLWIYLFLFFLLNQ